MASDDKVTVGEAHKPSQGTIDKAMALKDEGNRMLAGTCGVGCGRLSKLPC
jgi:hypothetical protein